MSWELKPINLNKQLGEHAKHKEYEYLSRTHQSPDALTVDEQEELRRFGYFALEERRNEYEAMKIFLALHDFQGLRKTVLGFRARKERYPEDYSNDYITTLLALEDYETIRGEYNLRTTPQTLGEYGNPAYEEIRTTMEQKINEILLQQKTPVATGASRSMLDLVTIYHLAKMHEVAIPVARGGLIQGAVAAFWGMQTFPLNISAHDKKVARAQWVNKPPQDALSGKRVLLFDKDAISGATMRKAFTTLQPFAPADITACFTWFIVSDDAPKGSIGTRIGGIPKAITPTTIAESPCDHAGDILIEAHERLETPLGQRRTIERRYRTELLPALRLVAPVLAQELEVFLTNTLQTYQKFNQLLPGISECRKTMLDRLVRIEKDFRDAMKLGFDFFPGMEVRYTQILRSTSVEGVDLELQLFRSRYTERAASSAKARGIHNPHFPSYPLAAHEKAVECARDGIEIAIIVGPEGFAYEPYFQDMRVPTLAVNIPESDPHGKRTFKSFDDLQIIEGKVVIIVEDDVRTGATLQKLLHMLQQYKPKEIRLFLGQPSRFQLQENIPVEITKTYLAGEHSTEENQRKNFRKFLQERGLKIYKDE